MASLKETKTRIASVKSTLQITAAMKMVAAAKLHRAQQAIGNMVPYQQKLQEILEDVLSDSGKIDPMKLNALIFDQYQSGYYVTGDRVGKAWNAGAGLMKG